MQDGTCFLPAKPQQRDAILAGLRLYEALIDHLAEVGDEGGSVWIDDTIEIEAPALLEIAKNGTGPHLPAAEVDALCEAINVGPAESLPMLETIRRVQTLGRTTMLLAEVTKTLGDFVRVAAQRPLRPDDLKPVEAILTRVEAFATDETAARRRAAS